MYGLIGKNIETSLSPKIHEMGFAAIGLEDTYTLIQPDVDSLFEMMTYIKSEGIRGFNVTVPYKEGIIPFLNELDDTAEMMGAVNVVKSINGKYVGYNTDGTGYVYALKYNNISIKDRRFLICGAGGAARGIAFALAKEGAQRIDFMNRTAEKATELANEIMMSFSVKSSVNQHETDYDVVINAISGENRLDLSIFGKNTIISDINYRPHVTPFLEKALHLGLKVHYGIDMLIYQALFAEEIWTDRSFSESEIKQVAGKIRKRLLEE